MKKKTLRPGQASVARPTKGGLGRPARQAYPGQGTVSCLVCAFGRQCAGLGVDEPEGGLAHLS